MTDTRPNQNYSGKRICSSSYSISSGSLTNPPHEHPDNSIKSNMLANVELSESFSLDEDIQAGLESKVVNNQSSNTTSLSAQATEPGDINLNSEISNMSENKINEPNRLRELPTQAADKGETNSTPVSILNELSKADMIKLNEARFKITSMRHVLTAEEEKAKNQSATSRESVMQGAFLKILGIKVNNVNDHDQSIEKSKPSGVSFEVDLDDSKDKQESIEEKVRPSSVAISKQNHLSSRKPASPIQGSRKGKFSSANSRKQENVSSPNKNALSESSNLNKTSQSQPGTPASKGGKRNLTAENKFRSRSPKANKESHDSQHTVSTKREPTSSKPSKSTHENNRKPDNSVDSNKDKDTSTKPGDAQENDSKASFTNSKETKGFNFIAEEDNENKQVSKQIVVI